MKRAMLRLVMKLFITSLRQELPPAGGPIVHDLEARCIVFIDAIPENSELDIPIEATKLDEKGVLACLEIIFSGLSAGYSADSWALLAIHLMRLKAKEYAPYILTSLLPSPGTSH